MSQQHKGHTDTSERVSEEKLRRLERAVEQQQAVAGILQTEVQEIVQMQKEQLSLSGNYKKWKTAYATGTSGTILTLFADQSKFIHLVKVCLSAVTTADSTITLNVIDHGGTARVFCRRHIEGADTNQIYNEVIDFDGLKLDTVRGTGATFNVMPVYGVEPGDNKTPRFAVAVTGTLTADATVIYFESEAIR